VLSSYLVMLERAVPRIEEALEKGDRERLSFAAHAIRSASKSVGALDLASLLATLEDHAPPDEPSLRALSENVLTCISQVRVEVQALLAAGVTPE
jgi:HPt (histidine-containing phosphotransfer) domain-containing protein